MCQSTGQAAVSEVARREGHSAEGRARAKFLWQSIVAVGAVETQGVRGRWVRNGEAIGRDPGLPIVGWHSTVLLRAWGGGQGSLPGGQADDFPSCVIESGLPALRLSPSWD